MLKGKILKNILFKKTETNQVNLLTPQSYDNPIERKARKPIVNQSNVK